MKKILVTGGAGYIGSHTLLELSEDTSFGLISIDNYSNSHPESYTLLEELAGMKIGHTDIDLCDAAATEAFFDKHRPDGIIHFAAFKAVGESVENPLKYYHNNLNALQNILKNAERVKSKALIFSSSCSVYGNITTLPVDENTPLPKAESPYAYSKQIGEQMISDFIRNCDFLKAISLRYFNPVGAHHSGKIGEWSLQKPNNLVPLITGTAIGKYPSLTVYGSDYTTRDGTCVRDYVHVSDIARAHILALKRILQNKTESKHEIFNLGTGMGVSVLEAIAAFEKVSGVRLNYTLGQRRPGDVEAVFSDSSLALRQLGWECRENLESMMESAWKWELFRKANNML